MADFFFKFELSFTARFKFEKHLTFQYGKVIKLPLQIFRSIRGQPYGILTVFLVNLLLDPILESLSHDLKNLGSQIRSS